MLFHNAKRLAVLIIGVSVLLVGVALLVLPGPAVVVIPVGLSILATEFYWARKILDELKKRAGDIAGATGITGNGRSHKDNDEPSREQKREATQAVRSIPKTL